MIFIFPIFIFFSEKDKDEEQYHTDNYPDAAPVDMLANFSNTDEMAH